MVYEGSRGQGFKDPSEMLKDYKELNVWQKSYELCLMIYGITAEFPAEERYGLTSQIRRSAVSIPSNIAEKQSVMEERQPLITLGCFTFLMIRFVNWKPRYYWQGI